MQSSEVPNGAGAVKENKVKPVLKYRGGKSREIPHLLPYIPDNFNRYIEPFFGGGALYFYLEPGLTSFTLANARNAIINDVNPRLMTFYRQLRDNYPEMRIQLDALQQVYEENQAKFAAEFRGRQAELTPSFRSEGEGVSPSRVPNANENLYYRMRELFNHPDGSYLDGVIYFFINKTAYSGMIRYNSKGEFNVPFGRYSHLNTELVTQQHSDLLQSAELFSVDYSQIFEMAEKDDFIFLDPPYDCVFNDYGNNEFDEDEHRRLAADFRNLTSRTLMVIGKTPLTAELYKDYICDEYYKKYAVNIKNRFKNDTMHLVVKNY